MFFQKEDGLYVYQSDDDFKIHYRYFENFNELFRHYSTKAIENYFGYDLFRNLNCGDYFSNYTLVLYDESGSFYTPDRIIGYYREWMINRSDYYARFRSSKADRKRRGKKLAAYRSTTTNAKVYRDLKMMFSEDNYVKLRAKRNARIISINFRDWDDYGYHIIEKSWKKQSKRKDQYKNG